MDQPIWTNSKSFFYLLLPPVAHYNLKIHFIFAIHFDIYPKYINYFKAQYKIIVNMFNVKLCLIHSFSYGSTRHRFDSLGWQRVHCSCLHCATIGSVSVCSCVIVVEVFFFSLCCVVCFVPFTALCFFFVFVASFWRRQQNHTCFTIYCFWFNFCCGNFSLRCARAFFLLFVCNCLFIYA